MTKDQIRKYGGMPIKNSGKIERELVALVRACIEKLREAGEDFAAKQAEKRLEELSEQEGVRI